MHTLRAMKTAHEDKGNLTDLAERNHREAFLVSKCFVIF